MSKDLLILFATSWQNRFIIIVFFYPGPAKNGVNDHFVPERDTYKNYSSAYFFYLEICPLLISWCVCIPFLNASFIWFMTAALYAGSLLIFFQNGCLFTSPPFSTNNFFASSSIRLV